MPGKSQQFLWCSHSAAELQWENVVQRILSFSNWNLLTEMFSLFCAWKFHPQGRYHVRKMYFTCTCSTHSNFCTAGPGGDTEALCPTDFEEANPPNWKGNP